MLTIPILHGTGRAGNKSAKVAEYVHELFSKVPGVATTLYHAADFADTVTYPGWAPSEKGKKWKEIVKAADGLIVVAPEYNHGYPGELKLTLDAAYEEYFHKPFAVCGVAKGIFGGSRMMEQLKLVAIELRMIPLRESGYFPGVNELFDERGNITKPEVGEWLKPMFRDMCWYAGVMKKAREDHECEYEYPC